MRNQAQLISIFLLLCCTGCGGGKGGDSGNSALLLLLRPAPTTQPQTDSTPPEFFLSLQPDTVEVGGTLTLGITCSEPVTGLTAEDIVLSHGSKGSLETLNERAYALRITTDTVGTLSVSIPASAAADRAGNASRASAIAQATVTAPGQTDGAAPEISIALPSAPVQAGETITATITCSEDVTGLLSDDVLVSGGVKGAFTAISAREYRLIITAGGAGTIEAWIPAGAAADAAGNASLASALARLVVEDNGATDTTRPSISVALLPNSVAPGGSLTATITCSEAVNGLTADDLSVTGATKGPLNAISAQTYVMTLTAGASGIIEVSVAEAAAADNAGNPSLASSPTQANIVPEDGGESDTTAPQITIEMTPASVQPGGTLLASIACSEAVTGLTVDDLVVSGGTKGAFTTVSQQIYTLAIVAADAGTVTVQVPAAAAQDAAGNASLASAVAQADIEVASEPDTTAPTIAVALSTDTVSAGGTLTATITCSEPVSGFDISDIAVSGSTKGAFTAVSQQVYTLAIVAADASTVTVQVPAAAAQDAAGNASLASAVAQADIEVASEPDTTAPTIAVVLAPDTVSAGGTLTATITCSEEVSGLEVGDIVVSGGTKGAFSTVSPLVYTLAIVAADAGTVIVQVPAAAAQDAAGNASLASAVAQAVIEVATIPDTIAPSVTVALAFPVVRKGGTVTITITCSEPLTGLSAYDVSVTGGTKGTWSKTAPLVYTLAVTAGDTDSLSVVVPASAAADTAGNVSLASNTASAALVYAPWSSATGRDSYGIWADLTLTGNGQTSTQRFRFIAPGTLQMGSEASEAQRGSDEARHQVTLTRAYWLADSECTQRLWKTVTGSNPSLNYNQPAPASLDLPVEMVSWDDTLAFITALNAMSPELRARLPTEAEWENGARAGTTTPFGLASVSSETVNVTPLSNDGYIATGASRDRTVIVKSLPANAWGLHEMHGNVSEWVSDWYGSYMGTTSDPTGHPIASNPITRGGSYNSYGRNARSARRYAQTSSANYAYTGFRLAVPAQPDAVRPTLAMQLSPIPPGTTSTITICANESISGLTADDIAVSGYTGQNYVSTKGALTVISPRVFTLQITTPPTHSTLLRVTIPAGAASDSWGNESIATSAETAIAYAPWAAASGSDDKGVWADLSIPTDTGSVWQRFRLIRPGAIPQAAAFHMGSLTDELGRDNDEDRRYVEMSTPYWMADTECTQRLWTEIVGTNPSINENYGVYDPASPDCPVENVSWQRVQEFFSALQVRVPSMAASLPSEAQWEYAARANSQQPFGFDPTSTDPMGQLNCKVDGSDPYFNVGSSVSRTVYVTAYPPNRWGLYGMHGNVGEWCADWYGAYDANALLDPTGPSSGTERVVRGGSYLKFGQYARSASRWSRLPDNSGAHASVGFRFIVPALPPAPANPN